MFAANLVFIGVLAGFSRGTALRLGILPLDIHILKYRSGGRDVPSCSVYGVLATCVMSRTSRWSMGLCLGIQFLSD